MPNGPVAHGLNRLLDHILEWRADWLVGRLEPHLPESGIVLDIGAGTGHVAQALRQRRALEVVGVDVANLGVVGVAPVLFDGLRLPLRSGCFAAAVVLFVLHYAEQPSLLLGEALRVADGPVAVLQSTYRGRLGLAALRLNEWLWGRVSYRVARATHLIGDCPFSLAARRFYTRPALLHEFGRQGCRVVYHQAMPWPVVPVSYDLLVLQRGA